MGDVEKNHKTRDLKCSIKIDSALRRSIPRRIKEPAAHQPDKAARVAVPIIITAAVRTLDTMTGGGGWEVEQLLEPLPLSHPKGDSSFQTRINPIQSRDSIFLKSKEADHQGNAPAVTPWGGYQAKPIEGMVWKFLQFVAPNRLLFCDYWDR